MQVTEGAADAAAGGSSPSKAAAKRARKKAARKAAAVQVAQVAEPDSAGDAEPAGGSNHAATPASRADAAVEQGSPGHSSVVPAAAAAAGHGDDAGHHSHTNADTQKQPTAAGTAASDRHDSSGVAAVQLAVEPAEAFPQWCRCPLSGGVMRDPVLLGGGDGTSFERAAVEAWLEAHPGVAPLTLQPLPPSSQLHLISNHALRQMIQQRSISATC